MRDYYNVLSRAQREEEIIMQDESMTDVEKHQAIKEIWIDFEEEFPN